MNAKATFFALSLLAVSLLTGCNAAIGEGATASQSIGEKNKSAKQQDIPSDGAQAEERARLAEERAKIAEEKAELEKQKREFAEQQLRKQQAEDTPEETSSADTVSKDAAPVERASVPRRRSARTYTPSVEPQKDEGGESEDSCTCPDDEGEPEDEGGWPEEAEPPAYVQQHLLEEAAVRLVAKDL